MTHEEVAYEMGRDAMRESVKDEIADLKANMKRLEDLGVPPFWGSFQDLLDALIQTIEPKS